MTSCKISGGKFTKALMGAAETVEDDRELELLYGCGGRVSLTLSVMR